MSQHNQASYLVTYDIADKKRLVRLFKYLKKQGVPVQYSVFLVTASATQIEAVMAQIAQMIQPDADDVRAYRLAESGVQITMGTIILPIDVLPGWPPITSSHA